METQEQLGKRGEERHFLGGEIEAGTCFALQLAEGHTGQGAVLAAPLTSCSLGTGRPSQCPSFCGPGPHRAFGVQPEPGLQNRESREAGNVAGSFETSSEFHL